MLPDEPSIDQINAKKSTQAEVYAQVKKDLQASIPLLPVTAEDKGRVTKGAAWGLPTRVYLYQEKWQACADAAEEVMRLGYELFPSYRGLFLEANENNSEVIFDVQFLQPRYPTSWDIYLGIYDPLNAPGWSSIEPTQDMRKRRMNCLTRSAMCMKPLMPYGHAQAWICRRFPRALAKNRCASASVTNAGSNLQAKAFTTPISAGGK